MTSRYKRVGNFAFGRQQRACAVAHDRYYDNDDGMDSLTLPQLSTDAASDYGSDIDLPSDYGSDLEVEEQLLGEVLAGLAANVPKSEAVIYPSIEVDEDEVSKLAVVIHKLSPSAVRFTSVATKIPSVMPRGKRPASIEVEYYHHSRQSWSVPREFERASSAAPDVQPQPELQDDIRSPLERFRTQPKKPLSVTDLVSPAWCELQYWYTLTKFGRKPRTAAMKQGSKVHRVLEEQVHRIVPVQTKTKEDRFGLKIWNTIQGLRTLRETGLTRELEVWGVIDGQVVNGIIDEISYACPDAAYEEELEKKAEKKAEKSGGTLPLGQLKIEQSFNSNSNSWFESRAPERKAYIADVKTRGVKHVPNGASLRPTYMQLMLYRKLLEALAFNMVDAETIFARYSLNPLEPFSEIFTLEISGLTGDGEASDNEMPIDSDSPFSILQVTEIQQHNSLLSLWSLMISEFSETIDAFSDILRAEFRYSKTGEIIGSTMTAYDSVVVEDYIATEMQWWKGERDAKGVEIEEAFKCRTCDFTEQCSWRKVKVEEAIEKSRLRAKDRGKSAV